MKKGLVLTVSIAIAFLIMCVATAGLPTVTFASALDVSETDQVSEINGAEDFTAFVNYASSEPTTGKNFILNADIDISDEEFSYIGNVGNSFNGIFDGNGHSITVKASGNDYVSLFGYLGNDGEVKNLTVKGSFVGRDYVGGIAGYNTGKIINCVNEASITGNSNVGGIVGYNTGTVSSCINGGSVSSVGGYCGGIVGESIGKILGCFNAGRVGVTVYGGGIVGRTSGVNGVLSSCVNAGEIAGSGSSQYVGGITGETSSVISDCYNYAEITASGISIGSAVGNIVSVTPECGRIYNVGGKSTRNAVGSSSVTVPETFGAATVYSILSGEKIFGENAFVRPRYDVGYGYLDCPEIVAVGSEYLNKLRIKLFGEGEGTEEDPFVVSDGEDWNLFSINLCDYGYENIFVKLNVSLNLGEITPLGKEKNVPFGGTFDGGGHKLQYSCSEDGSGLFGEISSTGIVKNLIVSVNLRSDERAGGITPELYGKVLNVTVGGTVFAGTYAGGIAAKAYSSAEIDGCENLSSVGGNDYVGGIVGLCSGARIANAVNGGTVSAGTAATYSYFGGIGGYAENSSCDNLADSAKVSSYKASYVGGLFGYASKVTVNGGFVTGEVTGRRAVGGIFGESAASSAENCGVITKIFGASYVGGICGRGAVTVSSSYFSGTFGTVNEAQIDKTTFRTVAQDGAIVNSDVYYNSDLITEGSGGVGKSYVELTNGLFDGNDKWLCSERELSFGSLPIIKYDKICADPEFTAKVRYGYFGGGTGVEDNKFIISDEQQYRNVAELISSYVEYTALAYELTSDLTFVRTVPVIGGANGFSGIFDGNGHRLYNARLDNAMFNSINNGGTVVNIGIENGVSSYSSFAAAVAAGGTVLRCYSLLNIAGDNVGGIVGDNSGVIDTCVFAGRVNGVLSGGGLVCVNRGTVRNSVFNGYVEGAVAGGICAESFGEADGTIVNGTVNGLGGKNSAGGFFGKYSGSESGMIRETLFIGKLLLGGVETEDSAFFAGVVTGVMPNLGAGTGVFYNGSVCPSTAAYYSDKGVASDGRFYAKLTSEFVGADFVNNFTSGKFTYVGKRSEDSDYAPKSSAFLTVYDNLAGLAEAGSEIGIYGRNPLSDKEWGSVDNPYLISAASEFAVLSDSVKSYSYDGKYFLLIADIDFSGTGLRPIGLYAGPSNSGNRSFNGVFDGGYHTISNLTVGGVNTDESYFGLFGYTGKGFVLKNLRLDETCAITSTGNFVGGLVGYNRGSLRSVINGAAVSGNANVGGLVGFSENNTEISDSVFCGTAVSTETSSAFGLTGQQANTVGLVTYGSKILFAKSEEKIVAGRENYVHNEYGDVLFTDLGGVTSVCFDGGKIVFSVASDNSAAKVRIMTAQDIPVYTGNRFDLSVFERSAVSAKFYVRFTYSTYLEFTSGSEEKLNTDSYGQGYYYDGQKISFKLDIRRGSFLSYDIYYDGTVTFTAEAEKVVMTFTVRVDGENKCVLSADIAEFSDYYDVPTDKPVYDGEEKTVAVTAKDAEIFRPFEYVWYDGDENKVDKLINAGTYKGVIKLLKADSSIYLGSAEIPFTVERKEIVVSDAANYWNAFAVKEYDGTVTAVKEVAAEALSGIIDKDKDGVTVKATVTFDGEKTGTHSAVINGFGVSGNSAGNYFVTEKTINADGEITVKVVTVTVSENNLKGYYNGNMPVISGAVFGSSIDGVTIKWTFSLLKADGTVDENWAALSESQKTWNVGKYSAVPTTDNANYAFACDCVYEIMPKVVIEVEFSGYNGLVYTGEDLRTEVKGIYSTDNGGKVYVSFRFYDENGNEVTEIVNSGSYTAVPYITDGNYILSETLENLNFTVKKAAAPQIEFSLSAESVTVGERLEITLTTPLYDAELTAEILTEKDGRGNAKVMFEGGKYYFLPTKYPSGEKLYFRLKSVNSQNYEDGLSADSSVKVTAGVIYVGLAEDSRSFVFGDIREYNLIYSKDEAQNEIIAESEIAGFVPSEYEVEEIVGAGNYSVRFYGGGSDGYIFRPSVNDAISIGRKEIRIIITADAVNSKIYGEADGKIEYRAYGTDGFEELKTLADGTPVILNGNLGRAPGENVGLYEINAGTLVNENNPDYIITYGFAGRTYEITHRHLVLVAEEKRKQYGKADPELTFRIADGYSFAPGEDESAVKLELSREAGENVGRYSFIKGDYNGGANYVIDGVDVETYFFYIDKVSPTVVHYGGTVRYGDSIGTVNLTGNAFDDNRVIEGAFRWVNPDETANSIGTSQFTYEFVPKDSVNYLTIREKASIEVKPRIAEVVFDGSSVYTYNGRAQGGKDIKAKVINALNGDTFDITYEYENSVDAGEYSLYVTDLGNEKYILDYKLTDGKGLPFRYTVQRAVVTVKVSGNRIKQGETFRPEITYEGFVNGEDESVLIKAAKAVVPTEAGIYQFKAEGAESNNYTFVYPASELVVERTVISDGGVEMKGEVGVALTLQVISENVASGIIESQINKGMKYNLFIPNGFKLRNCMELHYNGKAEGEFTYAVTVDVKDGEKLYVKLYDGTVKEITDYEKSETGVVTFNSEQVSAIAVYEKKEITELLKDYLPLIIAAAVAMIIIAVVIAVAVAKSKSNRKDKAYLSRYDR